MDGDLCPIQKRTGLLNGEEIFARSATTEIKKSSSFNEDFKRKKRERIRTAHTVPSDKDESRRLENFRRECLSKAIQWNLVDLIHCYNSKSFEPKEFLKYLSKDEGDKVLQLRNWKDQFRMFLCKIQGKKFGTMVEWLTKCEIDKNVVDKVHKTFDEFSDKENNFKKMKCFTCKLSSICHVSILADHLISADIIDHKLYERAFTTEIPVGLQTELWSTIIKKCRLFPHPVQVFGAIKIALTDAAEQGEASYGGVTQEDLHSLLSELEIFTQNPASLLHCHCAKICSNAMHPLSCVKSMPTSQFYFRKSKVSNKGPDDASMDLQHSSTNSSEDTTSTEQDADSQSSGSLSYTCDENQVDYRDDVSTAGLSMREQNSSKNKVNIVCGTAYFVNR